MSKRFLCYETEEAERGEVNVNNCGVLIGGYGAVVSYKGELTDGTYPEDRIKFKATPDEIKMHYEKGDLIKLDYLDPGSEPNTMYFKSAVGGFSSVLLSNLSETSGRVFSYTDGWYTATESMF